MINTGDTAFMLIATAFVMLMTPGLALFYGGLVRSKNVLSVLMQSFICLGAITVIWVLYGYSLSFGSDIKGLIGSADWIFLKNVGTKAGPFAETIPHILFCAFQLMFAVITPALITGAFAERMKFSAFLVFIILWSTFVYFPVCHWVWGGGWISRTGALDFAGGTVIHINSASAALAAAIMTGKRKGWSHEIFLPHNLSLTILGAGLLWFGWFGFNAGSALGAGEIAANAFMTTQIAAGCASFCWLVVEWIHRGKPTVLGAVSGAIAGLVAVTPGAGFIGPGSSMAVGVVAGILCYLAIAAKTKFGYDDALDVIAIHGVGGLWGAIATGIFASKAINPAVESGLIYGNFKPLFAQTVTSFAVITFSFAVSFAILKLLDMTIGLRASEESEIQGLDISEHNETCYANII